MNQLDHARKIYDDIPIPERLEETVAMAVRHARSEHTAAPAPKKKTGILYKWGVGIAAGLLLGFTFLVNTNTALAAQLSEVPVIGSLVRLVTIESYQEKTDDYGITVEVPSLQQIGAENAALPEEVNQEISKMCSQYVAQAKQRALEYKEAYMATGGTLEEWKEHNIQINVGYAIISQDESYLSFTVSAAENWTSAYAETRYYNLDLQNMEYITLQSLLGDNYVNTVNENIQGQIAERSNQPDQTFFTAQEGGFQTIADDQNFYINTAGNPVIVFDKYTIAPGSMGNVEFEIKRQ